MRLQSAAQRAGGGDRRTADVDRSARPAALNWVRIHVKPPTLKHMLLLFKQVRTC